MYHPCLMGLFSRREIVSKEVARTHL